MSLPLSALAGAALLAMTLLSIAHGLIPKVPELYAGLAAWAAGVILVPGVRGPARVQILAMLGVGIAAQVWALGAGGGADWAGMASANQALLAMLAAVSFLRLAAMPGASGPEDQAADRAGREVAGAAGARALVSTLLAVHLLGSVINLSAVMILGDRLSGRRPLTLLQAQALSRGFAMAANWSPFFVAMGVALTAAPGAELPVLVLVGLPVAALALAFAALELGLMASAQGFAGYPMEPRALALPLTLAVTVLALHWAAPGIAILTLVSALSLVATLALLALREGGAGLARFIRFVPSGLPGMAGELGLFLAAGVLAGGVSAAVGVWGPAPPEGPFGAGEASLLLLSLVGLSVVGIHPVIGISTLAGLLAPLSPDPNLLALVYLMAWALAITASPFSGLHLGLQGRYGIDSHLCPRLGWRFALFVLAVDSAALFAYVRLRGPD
jgi:hypothetical protein